MLTKTTKEVSVFEYAKIHNTTPHTVYRWIREGKIPKEKVKIVVVKVKRKRILV
jgi:DNA invertase Pin-like site-specific DNA recombinase